MGCGSKSVRPSRRDVTTYACCILCRIAIGAQCFLMPNDVRVRLYPSTSSAPASESCSKRRIPRLRRCSMSNINGEARTSKRGATNSPMQNKPQLRILPNFLPQEKRRPKTQVIRDINESSAFLAEQSIDMSAMAWAEFSDWLRRTVDRNVQGSPFEFDRRQWSSSIRKWWSRAVEMDEQAKAELFRIYDRGMLERDSWGNQAAQVDARVEDEWDNIYVECQDYEHNLRRSPGDVSVAKSPATPSLPQSLSTGSVTVSSSSRTMEATPTDDEADGDSDAGEEEEIIDCAIRGRWSLKYNDNQPCVDFLPQ